MSSMQQPKPNDPKRGSPVVLRTVVTPVPAPAVHREEEAESQSLLRRRTYGLPCAKCRTYYSTDLDACPVCKGAQRISGGAKNIEPTVVPENHDDHALERERERFLRELKLGLLGAQQQDNAFEGPSCALEKNHNGVSAPATVCQTCYTHLHQRVAVLESALRMDVETAARIVYEAVWADPSDSSKTYQNAAQALLAELHKRAGIVVARRPSKAPLR